MVTTPRSTPLSVASPGDSNSRLTATIDALFKHSWLSACPIAQKPACHVRPDPRHSGLIEVAWVNLIRQLRHSQFALVAFEKREQRHGWALGGAVTERVGDRYGRWNYAGAIGLGHWRGACRGRLH